MTVKRPTLIKAAAALLLGIALLWRSPAVADHPHAWRIAAQHAAEHGLIPASALDET